MAESIETVIVGGGQAGMALSYYLRQLGREHLVLEKAELPGEAWRNQRWDTFTLVTPNWAFQIPGAEYNGGDRLGYLSKAEIVECFEHYPQRFRLPVRHNTQVQSVEADDAGGYLVTHQQGRFKARNVVIATGLYQKPKIPAFAAQIPADVVQMHCSQYRNPQALPDGGVLVIGSAQSGSQIAEDLNKSGRKVFLATGSAPRVPRRYRGRDIYEWANLIGFLDRTPAQLPTPAARFAPNPQAVGCSDYHDIDLHLFFRAGMHLLGHLRGIAEGKLIFALDLKENLAKCDQAGDRLMRMIDQYIEANHLDAPPHSAGFASDAYQSPDIETLDLRQVGISALIWANGFSHDFSLVKLPVTDDFGFPVTQRGGTRFPGLYFLGMPWLFRQKSGLLLGVGEDAAYLAERIQQ